MILLFTEEYQKITKGMFLVFKTIAKEISSDNKVQLLVNHEHWCKEEILELSREHENIRSGAIYFMMPSTLVFNMFSILNKRFSASKIIYVIGHMMNFLFAPILILLMAIKLRFLKVDKLFSHNGGWPGSPLCRWILISAKLAGIKSRVLVIHNYPALLPKQLGFIIALFRSLEAKIVLWSSTKILTVSDSLKNDLETKVFKSPVYRIHNGIQLDKNTGAIERELNYPPLSPVVGFIGALYPYKGPLFLLKSFRHVGVGCELALLGPGEPNYLQELKKIAGQCKNPVHFLGFHENVDSFFEKIDFLVVPSIAFESFGMVILEAMKHKKAVICTDFGGMKEIVVDNETGFVIKANDEYALAEKIELLLKDSDLAKKMGERGYERLQKHFTAEIMGKSYLEAVGAPRREC